MNRLDFFIMGFIVLILIFLLTYKLKICKNGNKDFFDLTNTTAIKGICAIIVFFVHIPLKYQNTIQDLIGSFAYIAVTFFFMLSVYNMFIGLNNNKYTVKNFLFKRILKLLLINFCVNILNIMFSSYIFGFKLNIKSLFFINDWLRIYIIICILFWFIYYIIKSKCNNIIFIVSIIILSIIFYYLNNLYALSYSIWFCEIFGCIWGYLLFFYRERIYIYLKNKWFLKIILLSFINILVGYIYIRYKNVLIYGDYLLKVLLAFLIIVLILILNTKISIENKFINFFGKISFEFFLVHIFILRLINNVFSYISSGIYILICFVITIFVSYLISLITNCLIKIIYKREVRL